MMLAMALPARSRFNRELGIPDHLLVASGRRSHGKAMFNAQS